MTEPLLEVTDVTKHYPIRSGLVIEREVGTVRAVDGVGVEVPGIVVDLEAVEE